MTTVNPPECLPRSVEEARANAKRWVAAFIARDYTADDADRESFMGYGGPNDAGYDISRGKIIMRDYSACPARRHSFSFRQLADEIGKPEQALLF